MHAARGSQAGTLCIFEPLPKPDLGPSMHRKNLMTSCHFSQVMPHCPHQLAWLFHMGVCGKPVSQQIGTGFTLKRSLWQNQLENWDKRFYFPQDFPEPPLEKCFVQCEMQEGTRVCRLSQTYLTKEYYFCRNIYNLRFHRTYCGNYQVHGYNTKEKPSVHTPVALSSV